MCQYCQINSVKICSTCKEEKILTCKNFRYRKDYNSFQNQCRLCGNKINKQWKQDNPEKFKLSNENWAKNNQDKIQEYEKSEHRKQMNKEYNKQWRQNNPNYGKEYYSKPENKERQWSTQILKLYNITSEQYYEMEKQQNNCCKICKTKNPGGSGKRWAIDHYNDEYNKPIVRGLLCSHCNQGMGHFKHDTLLLEEVIKYLKSFRP